MKADSDTSKTAPLTRKARQGRPGWIRAAAILQTLYALIEVIDCLAASLMALGLVTNPYPAMLFKTMQSFFDNQAGWLIPLFLFYTVLRAASAIGLWQNRLWGFWLTIFATLATLIMAPLLLPFTAVEMLLNGLLMIVLLIGYLGDRRIYTGLYPEAGREQEQSA